MTKGEKRKIKKTEFINIKSNRHSLQNHWDVNVLVLIIQNIQE